MAYDRAQLEKKFLQPTRSKCIAREQLKMVPIICQGIPGHRPPYFYLLPFLSCFLLPFWVSLSVFCARKLCLLKSFFLNKKIYQMDSLIPTLIIFILRWRWRRKLHVFCWRSKRAQSLLHWMGGGGGGGGGHKCCAGGPKGIALASFYQGLMPFWV